MAPKTYRPDQGAALARIEAARLKAGVSREALAQASDMSERTYRRALADGRAWPRQVEALRMALRSLSREARDSAGMYPASMYPEGGGS